MTLSYVPAGVETYTSQRTQLGIKLGRNEKEFTEFGKKFKRWHTFEKTVTYTISSTVNSVLSTREQDVIVPMFSATYVKACGLTKILANPIHRDFVKAPFKAAGIESIVDSGGFQLLKGTVDFVSPDDVVARYNEHADIGMPLDLPVRATAEKDYFDPVSRLIKANDDYILERLDKGVHLALISHGTNLDMRRRRLDVLERTAEVVAIAGLNITPAPGVDKILNNVETLMYVLQRYHKKTRYFHVLGVTSKLWIFIYALIDASKFVKEIGADSVSHRLSALVGLYDTNDFKSIQLPKLKYKTTLPCNCPICSSVDDTRILHAATLLEAHNLWVRAKQTEMIEEMAIGYLAGTVFLKEVVDNLNLSISVNKLQFVVNYILDVVQTDKWKPIKQKSQVKSLFGDVGAPPTPQAARDLNDHYQKVIRRYEKFHKRKFL